MIRLSVDIDMPGENVREATDSLNASLALTLAVMEDEGRICGWSYGVDTLKSIISGEPRATHREQITDWVNSLNDLHSPRLSSIGIDDQGDLLDEVPTLGMWMDRLFDLIEGWGQ